jgi:quinol monooxygenase YgiN
MSHISSIKGSIMSSFVYITVIIHCKPERVNECLHGALETRDRTLKEEGCISFIVSQSIEDPTKIIFSETYLNYKAFEFHQEQNYTQNYGTTAAEEYASKIYFYLSKEIAS